MKIIKLLTLSLTFLFTGMNLVAEDQNNPPECESWTCSDNSDEELELIASSSALSDVEICDGTLPADLESQKINEALELISIKQGVEVCVGHPDCTRPTSVTKNDIVWSMSGDAENSSGSTIYTLTGTATSEGGCMDSISFTFNVTLDSLRVISPYFLLLCETEKVKVNCNKEVESVEYTPEDPDDPVLEVVGSDSIKGLRGGTATIEVYVKGGSILTHTVSVEDCEVTEEPSKDSTVIITTGPECKEVSEGNWQWVYTHEALFNYNRGKWKYCKDGQLVEEDLVIPLADRTYDWVVSANMTELPDGNDKTIIRTYIEGAYQLIGKVEVKVTASWDVCPDSSSGSGSINDEASSEFDADEDVPLLSPMGIDPTPFAPQNKYTGLDIHGQPKSVVKPQQEKEEDSYKTDFNVDAYHLSPSFNTADISIPLQGTDLRLELRRTNSTDVTTTDSVNVDNMPYRVIMGRTWRANIAPVVYTYGSSTLSALPPTEDECTPPAQGSPGLDGYWVVVDDGGGEFKYSRNDFIPIKKMFSDFNSGLHSLTRIDDNTLAFRKMNGMTFIYESVNYSVGDSNLNGSGSITTVSLANFHRCTSITDRTGNKLDYVYNDADDLFPARIVYEKNPAMFIRFEYTADQTRLLRAVDPLGRVIEYQYSSGNLSKVIKTAAPVATEANPKQTTVQTQEHNFSYGTLTVPAWKENPAKTTHYLATMTDPESNSLSMTYDIFTESFGNVLTNTPPRKYVVLKTMTSPDGTFTATPKRVTNVFRSVAITDTKGNDWSYVFTGSTRRAYYSLGGPPQTEILLDSFSRTQHSSANLSRTMNARFTTDLNTTINLDYVSDYFGIITEYDYGRSPVFDEDGQFTGYSEGVAPVRFYRNGVPVIEDYDFGAKNQPLREIIDPRTVNNPDGLNIVKEFGYEPLTNQMVRIVDGNGNETVYDVDDQGNRLRELAPEGKITTFTYDTGFQTSAVDADGRKSVAKKIYSTTGWTDVNVQLLNYGDTRTYDDLSINPETYTTDQNDDKIVTIKKFDLVGNLIQEIDANGNVTDHTYDDSNAISKSELPAVFDHDSQTSIRPVINYTRDKNRQVLGKQDARGNWTLTKYDGMLRPIETTVELLSENNSLVTAYAYDAAGNKSAMIDPNGTRYTYEYDEYNNLIKEVKDANGLALTSTYEYGEGSGNDVFGDTGFVPTRKTDPRGIVTILDYDNAYRLIKTYRGTEDSETLLSKIDYDGAGNVIKTTTYNDRIAGLDGDYTIDSEGLISENQETVTIYDELNRPTATAVDLDGDGASINDADDIVTNTFYDLSGNVIITVDAEGHSTQTEYDAAGRVVKQVVNLDDNPDFGTVSGNNYAILADAEDIVTTKSYDDNANVLSETLVNDTPGVAVLQTVEKTYDALNRVTLVKDPESFTTTTTYDLNNNVRTVTNGRNFTTATQYDAANRAVKQILPEVFDAESEQTVNPEIITAYDNNSNIIAKTDARGLKTVNSYDALNRLDTTIQVLGATEEASENIISEFEYDGNNNQTKATLYRDDFPLVTETVYDVLDRPLITIDPEGYQSVVLCDLVGNKVRLFDKRSNANEDGSINSIPQLRYSTDVSFDRANRAVKNTLPAIPVASRSIVGTIAVQEKRPFSTINYLKNNWIDKTVDLNGNQTTTEYDAAGRKVKVVNAIGQDIDYTYDKAGNILTQKVQNNNASGGDQTTSYKYDKRNLLKTETLNPGDVSLQRVYQYTYDANGNKKTRIFPNLDSTTYQYDAMDRLLQEVYENATTENRTYRYNNNGAVVNCTDNTGKVVYQYDLLGRQLLEEKFNTAGTLVSTVESLYDKANNRVRCYLPDQKKTLVSSYDKRNLLVTLDSYNGRVEPGSEPALKSTTTYQYDPNGLQEVCTLPNGQVTTKTYDQADRILTSHTTNGSINGYLAKYRRDAVGNQLQTIETRSAANTSADKIRTLDFIYDDIYRLTHETDDVTGEVVENIYLYDLQGNRLSRVQKKQNESDQDSWTYTNDRLNRTLAVAIDLVGFGNQSSYAYQYDQNGNRLQRNYTDEDGQTSIHTYTYDQENRLIEVVDGGISVFKSSYDYRTRRTAKTETVNGGTESTVAYIYDGGVSCQEVKLTSGTEFDGTNATLEKQYIRGNGMGGGIGSVLYMERPADFGAATTDVQAYYDSIGYGSNNQFGTSGTVAEYFTSNAVGSVVANTDQDGFVIRENDFDAYGNIVNEIDLTTDNFPAGFGGSTNDLLFSTKERDFSTGLDYFGFRYYDPVLGKFTTRDPSGYPDGPNNYLYVNNNPINAIDPLGLRKKTKQEIKRQKEAQRKMREGEGNKAAKAVVDFVVPDPVGSFKSGQKNFEIAADPSKTTLERVGAGMGGLADGINTVIDSVPIVGKVKKKAAEKAGEGIVAVIENAPKLMDKAKNAVDKVKDGVGNMAEKIKDFFSPKKEQINIDTGAGFGFISENSPVRHELKEHVKGKQMVMTETAKKEFTDIVPKAGGPKEQARAEKLMKKVKVIPDDPSKRVMDLKLGQKVDKVNDKIIFGTGDKKGITTLTNDKKFTKGAKAQGVEVDAIVHKSVPLEGL